MLRRSLLGTSLCFPFLARGAELRTQLLPGELYPALGINAGWFEAQAKRQALRIAQGTAEHLTYYLLQSRRFTPEPAIHPTEAAHKRFAFPAKRAQAFLAGEYACARFRLMRELYAELGWTLERCYEHTMDFVRAKEIERLPVDRLYQERGLSSDTSPENLSQFASLELAGRRILLVGPGLDLTRRENFVDEAPLRSYQWDFFRERARQVEAVDIRPEVLRQVGARRLDITREFVTDDYDMVVATNVFVYLNEAELLCAMASVQQALRPGGLLVHNEMRFAAKVFGEAVGLEFKRYQGVPQPANRWDRMVIHRKVKT